MGPPLRKIPRGSIIRTDNNGCILDAFTDYGQASGSTKIHPEAIRNAIDRKCFLAHSLWCTASENTTNRKVQIIQGNIEYIDYGIKYKGVIKRIAVKDGADKTEVYESMGEALTANPGLSYQHIYKAIAHNSKAMGASWYFRH